MYILLSKNEIKHLKHEYRIRTAILMLFFISGAVWVGIVTLFPSYIFSAAQEQKASDEAGKIDTNRQAHGSGQLAAEIRDANTRINLLANVQDKIFLSSIIEDIVNERPVGLTINTMGIAHVGNATTKTSITLSGNAATRDILVAFKRSLEADPRFEKVFLPVSSLAQDTNINFTMSVNGIQ